MQVKRPLLRPILMLCAVIVCLAMIRLGFWQLDRAEQKRAILAQSLELSELPVVDVQSLVTQIEEGSNTLRFRQVAAKGQYIAEHSILIDNQVFDSQVGYALLTPLKITGSNRIILVDRGWLPVGASRTKLPKFQTLEGEVTVAGRLNTPYAKPPIWNDDYAVSDGSVWQYLALEQFRQQTGLEVLPLVLELAPSETADLEQSGAKINWQSIDDEWVFKHQAYAVQWFSMALVFFIACLIVLAKSIRHSQHTQLDE
ncbi:MAG: SURF1 family protein [Acidiferrobacterales bacterium]|nr:SURF1 family protein [Acidiferrobacterales bacterium]